MELVLQSLKSSLALFTAATALVGPSGLGVSHVTPGPVAVSVASCYVSGNAPYTSGTQLYGRANRAGCGDQVTLKAYIMQDVPYWPDAAAGYGEKLLVNGSVTGSGPCSRRGPGKYYVSARTDTGQRNDNGQRVALC